MYSAGRNSRRFVDPSRTSNNAASGLLNARVPGNAWAYKMKLDSTNSALDLGADDSRTLERCMAVARDAGWRAKSNAQLSGGVDPNDAYSQAQDRAMEACLQSGGGVGRSRTRRQSLADDTPNVPNVPCALLRELAHALGVAGCSRMRKAELVAALRRATATSRQPASKQGRATSDRRRKQKVGNKPAETK